MKLNKFIILGAAAALTLSSCSESFLDVTSKTEPNSSNYYKTNTQAYRALLGCYDGWRQIASNPGTYPIILASSIMSDECYGGAGAGDGKSAQVVDQFDPGVSGGEMNIYEQEWKDYYSGVYRCNYLIQEAGNIDWEDERQQGIYIGEARALRAIMYFDMVRLWGNIPLFLEPSNENKEQADPADVYANIFSDLRYAIDNIPADMYTDVADFGHVTKYAAEAIFARAYLYYTGYYKKEAKYVDGTTISKADALAACEDIIKSSRYSLVPEFKNLWPAASLVPIAGQNGWDTNLSTYAGDANSEIVLAMLFTPSQDYDGNNDSNRWLVNVGMRSLCYPPFGKGWGIATVTNYYQRKYFDDRDLRGPASVIDIYAEGPSTSPDFNASFKDWREFTGLTMKKYCPVAFGNGNPATKPDGTGDFMITNPQPWIFVRYADVLLMAAELGAPSAQAYLDMVRTRAGLPSVAPTFQNIMDERARELAYEGSRYWDLMRQGVEVMADAVVASAGKVQTAGNLDEVTYKRDQIIKTQGLSQIPQNQITLSHGVLKQNPGWY